MPLLPQVPTRPKLQRKQSTRDVDTSSTGRDAAEVQRCEGGLDSLAQCEVLSPLQELLGQASLLHDSQRRALLRLQAPYSKSVEP